MNKKLFYGTSVFLTALFCFVLFTKCKTSKINVVYVTPVPAEGGSTNQPRISYQKGGASFVITATPAFGFRVLDWNIDGKEGASGQPSITLAMAGLDHNVEVIFAPIYILPTPENPVHGKDPYLLNYTTRSNLTGFNMSFYNNFQNDANPCDDVSITIDSDGSDTFVPTDTQIAAPFQTGDEMYKNQYFCTLSADKRTISLGEHFRPLAKKFTIKIANTSFKMQIMPEITDADKLKLTPDMNNLPGSFLGCGQHGTIVQRAFDCSLLITNYHFNGSTALPSPERAHNFDSDWFVVGCPAGGASTTVEKCAWLTPVINAQNSAITGNFGLTLQDFSNAYLSGSRLLFSPVLTKKASEDETGMMNGIYYKLEEALGSHLWEDLTQPATWSQCSGNCYKGRNLPPAFWEKSNHPVEENSPCTTTLYDDILPKSAFFKWKLPTYPMLKTLTTYSSRGSNDTFSAAQIPGFVNKHNQYNSSWSSSYLRVSEDNIFRPIYFNAAQGRPDVQTLPNLEALKDFRPGVVRCVSTNWN